MESLNKRSDLRKCPRENASWLSYFTFFWVLQIFFKGKNKTLGEEDLFQPLRDQKADILGSELEEAFTKKSDLFRSFVEVFGYKVLVQGLILLFLECGVKILPPIFLSRIIAFYSDSEERSRSEAVWYSIGIISAVFLNVLILHAFNVSNLSLGFSMKTGACSLLYRKCLRLSNTTIGKITTGKIVNMMSNDVAK